MANTPRDLFKGFVTMEKTKLIFYLSAAVAFFPALFLGIVFFGFIVHESWHAVFCLIFGIPYSFSLIRVNFDPSPNPAVNTLIYLGGGIGAAFVSLLFFWLLTEIEKMLITKQGSSQKRQHSLLGILFSSEIVFLAMSFHGFINGIWEGLFTSSYSRIYDNSVIWDSVLVGSLLVAFVINFLRARSRSYI
jgi:hypothetical protein